MQNKRSKFLSITSTLKGKRKKSKERSMSKLNKNSKLRLKVGKISIAKTHN